MKEKVSVEELTLASMTDSELREVARLLIDIASTGQAARRPDMANPAFRALDILGVRR